MNLSISGVIGGRVRIVCLRVIKIDCLGQTETEEEWPYAEIQPNEFWKHNEPWV